MTRHIALHESFHTGLTPVQNITLLAAMTIIGLAAYWVARQIDNRWGRYR